MNDANDALQVFVPLCYAAAWTAYWLAIRSPGLLKPRTPITFCIIALVMHGGQLAVRGRILGQLPWTTYYDSLSALGFLMTLTYLLVELTTRVPATGYDLLPWPFVMATYAAAFGPHLPHPHAQLNNPLFALHTVPAIGGLAAVLVSGVYGVLYLRLERAIRAKKFTGLFARLPDLEVLARMNFFAALIGFLLVTAAIGWGATLYGDLFSRVDVTEPKIFLTLLVWAVLLVPAIGRFLKSWPDRATARLSVVTAGLALATILVPMLPFVGFHGHS